MKYTLVAIPPEEDLKILNNLRSYIYQNNFRFKNKSLDSDTHITLTEVVLEEKEIDILKSYLLKNIHLLKSFSIDQSEWILTKEIKEPNYKMNVPYVWIALKFSQRKEIYNVLDRLTKEIGVNNNGEYIKNVKQIEGNITDEECIANHINLSNYNRIDKADECWNYFNDNLPKEIRFNRIGLRDESGKLIFVLSF